jgi:hypothetical protein
MVAREKWYVLKGGAGYEKDIFAADDFCLAFVRL